MLAMSKYVALGSYCLLRGLNGTGPMPDKKLQRKSEGARGLEGEVQEESGAMGSCLEFLEVVA